MTTEETEKRYYLFAAADKDGKRHADVLTLIGCETVMGALTIWMIDNNIKDPDEMLFKKYETRQDARAAGDDYLKEGRRVIRRNTEYAG